ncbi:large ribosomal subunit protein mL52 [Neocloeon triangulifer]|uniref:large ribosomal subunit protein mL52 n=1 Tax=Neocloeon triangulifer TaxID=2078957 RepID=UPI00286EE7E8|nr:large ribosomal subunit protein mL52 [Neocloeon triangulifer]
MLSLKCSRSLIQISKSSVFMSNSLSTTSVLYDIKFRIRNRLPVNANASGPLTDGPDFSYLNSSKPVPLNKGQTRRLLKQQQLAESVLRLNSEIQWSFDEEKRLQLEEEQRKQRILDSKLKAKGDALLKDK